MLAEKVLSTFLTETGLDFDLFEKLLETSESVKNDICDLSSANLNLLVKILIDAQKPQAIAALLDLLEKDRGNYNPAVFILGLIKLGFFKTEEDLQVQSHLLVGLNKDNAFVLQPYLKMFPDKYRKTIEGSTAAKRELVEIYREDLKDQIEFLKSAQITGKAIEIEKKLKFHFPEIKENFLSEEQAEIKSKEHAYSKVIERNISFDSRTKSRSSGIQTRHQKHLKDDAEETLKLAKLWYSDLKDKNLDLLLTQLEFIDFDNSEFYLDLLKETDLDLWTKLFLYIKSKNYLEGLQFLEQHETDLLTESSDSIYNYYYTKGVMLLGAGMQKEAENIFTIIKEQKENFRDIQLLLKNVK